MKKFTTLKGVCFIMERKWKTIDTVIALLLAIFFSAFMLILYLFSAYFIGDKQEVEEPITGKISEKGTYFSPTYKVITENHGSSYVTKKQFYNVDRGGTITGYQTNNLPFFTTQDIIYDGGILIIIMIVLGIIVFSFFYYFYLRFKTKTEEDESTFNRWNQWSNIPKKLVNISLIIYILFTSIFLLLIFLNISHQIIPIGQTKVEANIIDEEIVKRYGRYAANEHYFYIEYSDEDDQEYLVKKRVNYHIYDTYKNRYGIPIHYQNSNPANAFIQLQSPEDYSTALMSFQTLLVGLILYSYSYIYNRYKKQKDSSAHK